MQGWRSAVAAVPSAVHRVRRGCVMSDPETEARQRTPPWVTRAPREVIETLPELNDFCLQVLAEQARAGCPHAAVSRIAHLWLQLNAAGRLRAANHPYLLFDAGFSDPQRWQNLDRPQINDGSPQAYGALFTGSRAVAASEMMFVFAWSLARRHPVQARLALGLHPLCAERITADSVLGAHQLGHRLWMWLRPRWLDTPEFWDELLQAAAEGGAAQLRARIQGMRLLAAQTAAALRPRSRRESA